MSDTDVYDRWTQQIGRLRKQITRLAVRGHSTITDELTQVSEECLTTSDSLLWEWAGSERERVRLAADTQAQRDAWEYLFDQMPVACVEVDVVGTIIAANRPAAQMLNISQKFLENRLLLHFAQDREQVASLIGRASQDPRQHEASIVIRPRERASIQVHATVVPRTPESATSWLWFLTVPLLSDYGAHKKPLKRLEAARE